MDGKKDDKKIVHNKAVAEFYQSGLKDHSEFNKCLDGIVGDLPNFNVDVFDIKDLTLVIPLFNKAILLYQLRKPLAALKIIFVLLKHLDALDTTVAERIGLLAIQLMLNLNQPKKAEAIITLLKLRLSSNSDLLTDEDDELSDLMFEKRTEMVKQTAKPIEEFQWMHRLYKLRSKILNEKPVGVPNEESPEMLVLKAHQYYIGHDYQMAAKELTKKPVTELSSFE